MSASNFLAIEAAFDHLKLLCAACVLMYHESCSSCESSSKWSELQTMPHPFMFHWYIAFNIIIIDKRRSLSSGDTHTDSHTTTVTLPHVQGINYSVHVIIKFLVTSPII